MEKRQQLDEVRFPQVHVQLTGQDGNVFQVIGAVSKAMKGKVPELDRLEFQRQCFNASSYDEVLKLCLRTVRVT